MITGSRGSIWAILGWQYKSAVYYVAAGALAWALHSHHSPLWHLPSLPLAVIGGALGIFVSFRTNTAYAR
ncbi:bestrophin family protein [Myxococcota bacterium]|nr:bestrophin family protein [Myxococcota bacterium]